MRPAVGHLWKEGQDNKGRAKLDYTAKGLHRIQTQAAARRTYLAAKNFSAIFGLVSVGNFSWHTL